MFQKRQMFGFLGGFSLKRKGSLECYVTHCEGDSSMQEEMHAAVITVEQ